MSVKKYADSTGLSEFWNKVKGRSIELTQSQYNALTTAEKENGTVYFITDGDPEYTIINDSVPIGAIQAFGGASVPYGWLLCDGSAVSRETYADLFAAIGITHGSGDGSTTFNLPDLRGRTLIGVGNSGATGSTNHTLGQKDGEEKHTLTVDEMPSHDGHMYGNEAPSIPDQHENTYYVSVNSIPQYGTWKPWVLRNGNELVMKGFDKGGSQAHNLMQPYTVANYIIKAFNTVSSSALKELDPQSIIFDAIRPIGSYYDTSDPTFDPNVQWIGTWVQDSKGRVLVAYDPDQTEFNTVGETGGEKTHTLTVDEMPSHSHRTGIQGDRAGSLNAGDSSAYVLFNQYSGLYTISAGGSQAHNNLQPYTVVYRWHRIA